MHYERSRWQDSRLEHDKRGKRLEVIRHKYHLSELRIISCEKCSIRRGEAPRQY